MEEGADKKRRTSSVPISDMVVKDRREEAGSTSRGLRAKRRELPSELERASKRGRDSTSGQGVTVPGSAAGRGGQILIQGGAAPLSKR